MRISETESDRPIYTNTHSQRERRRDTSVTKVTNHERPTHTHTFTERESEREIEGERDLTISAQTLNPKPNP